MCVCVGGGGDNRHPCSPFGGQGTLKDGFGEVAVVCNMPDPCKLLSLNSCSKRFLWTHKEVDLALHPVIGLVLQVRNVEKFPHAYGPKSLDPFFFLFLFSSKQGPCFETIEEVGGDKRLVQLELACKADCVAPPDPV